MHYNPFVSLLSHLVLRLSRWFCARHSSQATGHSISQTAYCKQQCAACCGAPQVAQPDVPANRSQYAQKAAGEREGSPQHAYAYKMRQQAQHFQPWSWHMPEHATTAMGATCCALREVSCWLMQHLQPGTARFKPHASRQASLVRLAVCRSEPSGVACGCAESQRHEEPRPCQCSHQPCLRSSHVPFRQA